VVIFLEMTSGEEFGTSCTVKRVGEYAPAMGPAPAKIVPGSGWLVFHWSLAEYGTPESTGMIACAYAAFGLNVPAKPPDSFHASGWPAKVG